MSVARFGTLADGTEIVRVDLAGGGLALTIITFGAVIQDLAFDAGRGLQRRVLGFPRLADYVDHSPYCGCIAGRYANRIAKGRCFIDGQPVELTRNENGRTHLHGGHPGFSHRAWRLLDHGPGHVTLELVSPDGEQGYPGNLIARCTYRISGDGELTIELGAESDRATLVNLAAHSYFNLDGGPDIRNHVLEIPALGYLPVDADLVPTGEIAAVPGTAFDFRQGRRIVPSPREDAPVEYDHNFIIALERRETPQAMARLTGPESRTRLEIFSTEPGLQFYDGARLDIAVPGHDGRHYGNYAGLCLEPQLFPDSPNHPTFPSALLSPGETYRQVTQYRFSAA